MALSIKLEERSFGGKKFRPQPIIDFDSSNNLLVCVTAWGRDDIAEKVIESIQSFISLSQEDSEHTIPYVRKENLQQQGNVLRMAIMTASEKIYNDFNKEEYSSGFEVFAAIQEGPQWIYVSCGQPGLVIQRKDMGIIPVTHGIDLNVLTTQSIVEDPLPNQLLGLGQNPPIQYGNIRLEPTDRIALISRTYLPQAFFKLDQQEFDLEQVSLTLAKDNQDIPFWLGFININQL